LGKVGRKRKSSRVEKRGIWDSGSGPAGRIKGKFDKFFPGGIPEGQGVLARDNFSKSGAGSAEGRTSRRDAGEGGGG